MIPYSKTAYTLLHEGVQALARVEHHGIRIDTEYLNHTITHMKQQVDILEKRIMQGEVYETWKKVFGAKTNLNSATQLGDVLFTHLGYESSEKTETGRPKTDEKALRSLDIPFVRAYLNIKKYQKALSTYLVGLRREVVDGYIHPFFNLHLASTYRSSSDHPNFQNIPVRDDEIGPLIRKAFIPRVKRVLMEIDYSGIEVRIAACYHKDPAMISYIKDKTKDMHRDMAMECYKLTANQVTKKIRYCGKNMFVFPQFYGDWYIDCAKHLWAAMEELKLETADGVPLQKHLANKGIKERGRLIAGESPVSGTFEEHIQQVEKNFWNKRFPVYSRWKKDWYERYQSKGWFKTKTGFICQGFMKRNEVINYPVQGSAFHCLLWSLTQLVLHRLRKEKMRTLIVGQIHDSIVADVPEDEIQDFLGLANTVMTKDVVEEWPWIIVPLEIEAEACHVGGSWADKKEIKIGRGE